MFEMVHESFTTSYSERVLIIYLPISLEEPDKLSPWEEGWFWDDSDTCLKGISILLYGDTVECLYEH